MGLKDLQQKINQRMTVGLIPTWSASAKLGESLALLIGWVWGGGERDPNTSPSCRLASDRVSGVWMTLAKNYSKTADFREAMTNHYDRAARTSKTQGKHLPLIGREGEAEKTTRENAIRTPERSALKKKGEKRILVEEGRGKAGAKRGHGSKTPVRKARGDVEHRSRTENLGERRKKGITKL